MLKGQVTPMVEISSFVARDGDARWFEGHPDRSHRLRSALVHEYPGLTTELVARLPFGAWMVIRQRSPGYRDRVLFYPAWQPRDSEAEAAATFILLMKAGPDQSISQTELRAVMSGIDNGGRA